MSDIALYLVGPLGLAADARVDGDDLSADDGLETAVLLSLCLNRRDGSQEGWWADAVSADPLDITGSRLWKLRTAKDIPATLLDARSMVEEALAWMLADHVAAAVDVSVTRVEWGPGEVAMRIAVTIHRTSGGDVALQYDFNWAAQALRKVSNAV